MRKTMLSPSILDSDFTKIRDTIKKLEKAGADYIHLDVMDGDFVPNLTFGPKIIKPMRKLTKLPFDTHLMISSPERYIDSFIDAGADIVTIHVEATKNIQKALNMIKKRGKKAGISIKPKTPVSRILKYLPQLHLVLIMSVEPGFGGQKFMEPMLKKARALRKIIDKKKYKCLLEIDGGISEKTAPLACAAGIDILVAGSAIFKSKNIITAAKKIKSAGNKCKK